MEDMIKGAYNIDNEKVEVMYTNGSKLFISCAKLERKLNTTKYSRAKLQRLLDEKPLEYIELALSGEMQDYCDIEDNRVKTQSTIMFDNLLKHGYCESSAESIIDEFNRYDS